MSLQSKLKPLEPIKKVVEVTGVCSERQLRRMCENGTVKATKLGSQWRVNTVSLLRQFGLLDD